MDDNMVLIIKPTYACNLNCKYCYLSEETKISKRFDVDFAENILRQAKECFLFEKKRQLTIIWHGGEPLLWGIKNYEKIFSFMEKEFAGYKIKNSMQTNL